MRQDLRVCILMIPCDLFQEISMQCAAVFTVCASEEFLRLISLNKSKKRWNFRGHADLFRPPLMDFSPDSLDFDVSGPRQECVSRNSPVPQLPQIQANPFGDHE